MVSTARNSTARCFSRPAHLPPETLKLHLKGRFHRALPVVPAFTFVISPVTRAVPVRCSGFVLAVLVRFILDPVEMMGY